MSLKKKFFCSLLLVTFVFIGFFGFRVSPPLDAGHQTLQWNRFDAKEIERNLDNGKLVLIFGNPLYHVEGAMLSAFFADPDVTKAIENTNAVLFYLEYEGWYHEDVDALFELTRRIKEPIVVFLKKGQQPQYYDASTTNEILTFAFAEAIKGEAIKGVRPLY